MIDLCCKCGCMIEIDEHHVLPAFMNNRQRSGETVSLCKKCHNMIHQTIIPSILFNHIVNKELVIAEIKQTTYEWISDENKQIRCKQCDADLDIEDRICPYCGKRRDEND